MGLCSSSRTAHRDVISPQGDNHAQIEIEFASLLNLENPHNINHKYIYLYKAVPDAWVGRTIKKTHAYVSFVSLQEIRKKREEFWGNFLASQRLACTFFRNSLTNSLDCQNQFF